MRRWLCVQTAGGSVEVNLRVGFGSPLDQYNKNISSDFRPAPRARGRTRERRPVPSSSRVPRGAHGTEGTTSAARQGRDPLSYPPRAADQRRHGIELEQLQVQRQVLGSLRVDARRSAASPLCFLLVVVTPFLEMAAVAYSNSREESRYETVADRAARSSDGKNPLSKRSQPPASILSRRSRYDTMSPSRPHECC